MWVDDFAFEIVGQDVPTTGVEGELTVRVRGVRKDPMKNPKNLDFED
jgi:hypothetical protein